MGRDTNQGRHQRITFGYAVAQEHQGGREIAELESHKDYKNRHIYLVRLVESA
jgi:hypothetical protein